MIRARRILPARSSASLCLSLLLGLRGFDSPVVVPSMTSLVTMAVTVTTVMRAVNHRATWDLRMRKHGASNAREEQLGCGHQHLKTFYRFVSRL